jgi:hypothetical protein
MNKQIPKHVRGMHIKGWTVYRRSHKIKLSAQSSYYAGLTAYADVGLHRNSTRSQSCCVQQLAARNHPNVYGWYGLANMGKKNLLRQGDDDVCSAHTHCSCGELRRRNQQNLQHNKSREDIQQQWL